MRIFRGEKKNILRNQKPRLYGKQSFYPAIIEKKSVSKSRLLRQSRGFGYYCLMLKIDLTEWKRYAHRLERFTKKGWPNVVRGTLNDMAFQNMRSSKGIVDKEMTQRNAFTKKRILVNKAKGNNVQTMESQTGHTEKYMKDQEMGGTKRKKTPWATSAAAGQRGQKPRTKLPQKKNKLTNIKLAPRRKRRQQYKSPKQRLLIKVVEAMANKGRVFHHKFENGTEGFFRVKGGRDRGKWKGRGWPRGAKIEMIASTKKKVVGIKATKWLRRGIPTQQAENKFYKKNIEKEIRKT